MTHPTDEQRAAAAQRAFHEADEAGCTLDQCWDAAIKAAIAHQRGRGWLPIETAPKDGTWIIAAEFYNGRPCHGGEAIKIATWKLYEKEFCRLDDDGFPTEHMDDGYKWSASIKHCTHWMPLPPAPGAEPRAEVCPPKTNDSGEQASLSTETDKQPASLGAAPSQPKNGSKCRCSDCGAVRFYDGERWQLQPASHETHPASLSPNHDNHDPRVWMTDEGDAQIASMSLHAAPSDAKDGGGDGTGKSYNCSKHNRSSYVPGAKCSLCFWESLDIDSPSHGAGEVERVARAIWDERRNYSFVINGIELEPYDTPWGEWENIAHANNIVGEAKAAIAARASRPVVTEDEAVDIMFRAYQDRYKGMCDVKSSGLKAAYRALVSAGIIGGGE